MNCDEIIATALNGNVSYAVDAMEESPAIAALVMLRLFEQFAGERPIATRLVNGLIAKQTDRNMRT